MYCHDTICKEDKFLKGECEMKNIMKRAWEIYRGMEGDHRAKSLRPGLERS